MVIIGYLVLLAMFAIALGVGMVSVPYKREKSDISYIVGLVFLFLISALALIGSCYFAVLGGFEDTLFYPISIELSFLISIIVALIKINGKQEIEEKSSVGLLVLSILFPLVGVILGIVNLCNKKSSGKIYLGTATASWIVNSVVSMAVYVYIYANALGLA